MKRTITILILLVLMAGCEEKADKTTPETLEIIYDSNEPNETRGITLDWFVSPVNELALYDFNNTVADPFIFTIDGASKQFTHQEFKRRLGFVEHEEFKRPKRK